MTIDSVRLPDEIEQGAKGGPTFSTTIVTMSSGAEQRNINWVYPRIMWDVAYGIKTKEDYQDVLDFFYARAGRAFGFLFKDWSDFEARDQFLGEGDAAETSFQLFKSYTSGSRTFIRRITRPIESTIVIYFDDVAISDSLWSLTAGGIIEFAPAPGASVDVSADFDFDVPVRFDTDVMALTLTALAAGTMEGLPVIELRDD